FFIALYGLHIHFVYLTKYLLLNKRVTIIDTLRLNENLVNESQSSINSDCLRIKSKTDHNKHNYNVFSLKFDNMTLLLVTHYIQLIFMKRKKKNPYISSYESIKLIVINHKHP